MIWVLKMVMLGTIHVETDYGHWCKHNPIFATFSSSTTAVEFINSKFYSDRVDFELSNGKTKRCLTFTPFTVVDKDTGEEWPRTNQDIVRTNCEWPIAEIPREWYELHCKDIPQKYFGDFIR